MRRLGAIFLLTIFLTGYVNLSELVKLQALVSHFLTHQDSNPDIHIFAYIHDHYCAEHFHCDQQDSHADLPFQHVDFHPVVVEATFAVLQLEKGFAGPQSCPKNAYYTSPHIRKVAAEIWQPPKIG
jgi:hypothetical protein